MSASLSDPRLATVDDARRIAEVHVRARRSAYRDLLPASLLAAENVEDRELRWMKRLADSEARCWLLDDDDGVFGFAHTARTMDVDLDPDCAELFALYLLPERIGHGFGRLLTTHAVEDLTTRRFGEVVLWFAEENLSAARFYAAAGFEVDPRAERAPFGETGLTKRRLCQVLERERDR